MKTSDLRLKTEDQLNGDLMLLRKEQLNFRLQKATGQLEASSAARIRAVRRDVARVKTVLVEQTQGKVVVAKAKKTSKKAAPKKAAVKGKKEGKE